MSDIFKTGSVQVRFKKDLPYMHKDGKPIDALKGEPQFKAGVKKRLKFDKAGKLAKAGYCDILDKQGDAVVIKSKK
jgi:hypothetical protein